MARNALNFTQFVQFNDWLRDNWKTFEGKPDSELAAAAGKALGLTVSVSAVNTACKASGIVRRKSARGKGRPAGLPEVTRKDFHTLVRYVWLAQRRHNPSSPIPELEELLEAYAEQK